VPDNTAQLPAAALSGDVEQFGRYLAGRSRDYVIVAQPDNQRVHVRFLGHFHGRPVVWDCDFVTLAAECANGTRHIAGVTPQLRNFIDIGHATSRGRQLRVGLSLPCIDRPAIEKMLIMIRNYKRLSLGRHEYGEAQPPFSHEV
jgi:hypothetical protein